jgi:hypothetical protein
LMCLLNQDGWRLTDVSAFFERYFEFLIARASAQGVSIQINSLESQIPGDFFDLIPQNIIIDCQGKWRVIDKEWVLNENIPAGWLLFRSLLPVVYSITRFGVCVDEFNNSIFGFVKAVFGAIGFVVTDECLDGYAKKECEVQEEVTGLKREADKILNSFRTAPLPRLNLYQTLTERDNWKRGLGEKIVKLNCILKKEKPLIHLLMYLRRQIINRASRFFTAKRMQGKKITRT